MEILMGLFIYLGPLVIGYFVYKGIKEVRG
jgi:hypothetical protein